MESWQVEQLRRSIVMLPPGHTAGAVDQAERLLDELLGMRRDNERYRALVRSIAGCSTHSTWSVADYPCVSNQTRASSATPN